ESGRAPARAECWQSVALFGSIEPAILCPSAPDLRGCGGSLRLALLRHDPAPRAVRWRVPRCDEGRHRAVMPQFGRSTTDGSSTDRAHACCWPGLLPASLTPTPF